MRCQMRSGAKCRMRLPASRSPLALARAAIQAAGVPTRRVTDADEAAAIAADRAGARQPPVGELAAVVQPRADQPAQPAKAGRRRRRHGPGCGGARGHRLLIFII
jgi:adenine-specific DNA methylase